MDAPLWTPSADRADAAAITEFRHRAAAVAGRDLADYEALHAWSLAEPGSFWRLVWSFCDVVGEPGDRLFEPANELYRNRFLPDARLNVAENLLAAEHERCALIALDETGARREMTFGELREQALAVAAALTESGVGPGDRVAAWLPHGPEAIVTMLGAATIGAVFSSTSPDFGTQGVLDRFGQIEPVVLVAADGYHYNGTRHDCLARLGEIRAALAGSLQATVVVGDAPAGTESWTDFVDRGRRADPASFRALPFDHPWYVLYSSGTTGPPKPIVHRTGGVLLQHRKEQRLHCDIGPSDRVLYVTTTGWMMWNWLASVLASGATVVLYDGSVFHPGPPALFDVVDAEAVTWLGVSAKYIDAIRKEGLLPARSHDLASLRALGSTGSPLAPEGFRYVYESVKADLHLASISGGTDLCGCFILGDPAGPVWEGELQRPALGMGTDVFDADGRSLRDRPGVAGELVCTTPFPSMPLGFWHDPDDARFRAAYFEAFPGVWTHGDFASWTEHGGMIVHGRSDTTLNPGGVRIGTAEIYRAVEQLDAVVEALVFGQSWEDDTRIVLLVRLAPGHVLDDALRHELRTRIRAAATPRHVPRVIAAVDDLPRTRSGKLVELAVSDAVNGRPVRNTEAIANPETIEAIASLVELRA
ncbi:MAG: acetoacetate--CoA ligase [Acidimicrobiia bacterium]|nr:acetoacetate--CoA ligase [Acidimicrobiia bacterium]